MEAFGCGGRRTTATVPRGRPPPPTLPARTSTLSQQRPSYHGSGAVAFSTKGEYGVRLMVALGRRHGSGPASLAELAAQEDLPRPYLEQLAMGLRDAGLLTSTRGARGGYQLARAPEDIPMAEVLRALEGPIAPMICASEDPDHAGCARTSRCTVNLLWLKIRDAITDTLDSITLADLVPQRAIAIAALGLRAGSADVPTTAGAAQASPAALAEPVTA